MTIRVGVLGAKGRMGETVCAAVTAASDCELLAALWNSWLRITFTQ